MVSAAQVDIPGIESTPALVLIVDDSPDARAIYGEYLAISAAPGVVDGNQLRPAETATTVRVQDGKTLRPRNFHN